MVKLVTGVSLFIATLVLWGLLLIGSSLAAVVAVAYWQASR